MKAPAAATHLRAGDSMGPYEIVEHLATGGMADVYLARSPHTGDLVALKTLRQADSSSSEYAAMLVEEAHLIERMNHPNVVAARDTSSVQSHRYFTMEYVEGATLKELLNATLRCDGSIPFELGIAVAMNVAAGLHYAHELTTNGVPLGVIHRDVSMTNILIGRNGAVKVADFGVAKSEDRETQTAANIVKGKVGYMSPEQCLGEPVDRRSDVFSLGIVLYEATTGRRLFNGRCAYERLRKTVDGDVPPPSSIRPNYPAELETIVMRALARDPDHRHSTAEEMRQELAAVGGLDEGAAEGSVANAMRRAFVGERELLFIVFDEYFGGGEPDTQVMDDPPTPVREHCGRARQGTSPTRVALRP